MNSCESVQTLIASYVANTLDDNSRQSVEAHSKQCQSCEKSILNLGEFLNVIEVPEIDPPQAIWSRLETALESQPPLGVPMETETLRIHQISECTICRGSLRSETTVYCAACLSRYHPDCFADHAQCAVIGCMETRAVRPLENATEVPQEATLPAKNVRRTGTTSSRTTVLVAMFALTLTTGIGLSSLKIMNDRLDSLALNVPAPSVTKTPPALPALTDKERLAEVFRLAAISKSRRGTKQSEAVSAIYPYLEDRDVNVRQKAATVLGTLPVDTSAALLKNLDHWDESTRYLICESLAKQADKHPEIISALDAKLASESSFVLVSALYSLELLGEKATASLPKIYRLTESDGPRVREAAFRTLEALTSKDQAPTVFDQLKKLAKNPKAEVREKAVKLLASTVLSYRELNELEAFTVFEAALKDKDPKVRKTAVKSILDFFKINPEACSKQLPQLIAVTTDSDRAARIQAIQAVGTIGKKDPRALQALFEAYKDKNESVRKQVSRYLFDFQINSEQLFPILFVALKDPHVELRQAAAYLYRSEVKRRPSTQFLKESMASMNDPDKYVRQDIRRSFTELGVAAEAAIPGLLDQLKKRKDKSEIDEIIQCLCLIGMRSSLIFEPFIEILGQENNRMKNSVFDALVHSECDPEKIVPILTKALRDPSKAKRQYVLSLIQRHGKTVKSATPVLMKILNDPKDKALHIYVIDTLSVVGIGHPDAVVTVLSKLRGEDRGLLLPFILRFLQKIRRESLFDGKQKHPAVIKILSDTLNDANSRIRAAAATAIQHYGKEGTEAIPGLVRALGDEIVSVRTAARQSLIAIGPEVLTQVHKAFEEPDQIIKMEAAMIIGAMGKDAKFQLSFLESELREGKVKNKETFAAIKAAISQIKRSLRREEK